MTISMSTNVFEEIITLSKSDQNDPKVISRLKVLLVEESRNLLRNAALVAKEITKLEDVRITLFANANVEYRASYSKVENKIDYNLAILIMDILTMANNNLSAEEVEKNAFSICLATLLHEYGHAFDHKDSIPSVDFEDFQTDMRSYSSILDLLNDNAFIDKIIEVQKEIVRNELSADAYSKIKLQEYDNELYEIAVVEMWQPKTLDYYLNYAERFIEMFAKCLIDTLCPDEADKVDEFLTHLSDKTTSVVEEQFHTLL